MWEAGGPVCFNLGLAGSAGAWFTLVRPVWRRYAGVAGARFTLTRANENFGCVEVDLSESSSPILKPGYLMLIGSPKLMYRS